MIILDTCILIFDNLTPERLSKVALEVLERGETMGQLCCSDISLWEIAMLEQKRRIIIATDYLSFMQSVLQRRILPIIPEIAALSVSLPLVQADPADRLIAATTLFYHAQLLTADQKLLDSQIPTLW